MALTELIDGQGLRPLAEAGIAGIACLALWLNHKLSTTAINNSTQAIVNNTRTLCELQAKTEIQHNRLMDLLDRKR